MAEQYKPRHLSEEAGQQGPNSTPGQEIARRAVQELFLPWPETIKGAHDDIRDIAYDRLVGHARPSME